MKQPVEDVAEQGAVEDTHRWPGVDAISLEPVEDAEALGFVLVPGDLPDGGASSKTSDPGHLAQLRKSGRWSTATIGDQPGPPAKAEDSPAFESIEDELLASQVVEDALLHDQRERRRRMRPIEDAAQLDPADPEYGAKLQELVEEVKANLAADAEAVPLWGESRLVAASDALEADAAMKKSLDSRWRKKRLAKMKER